MDDQRASRPSATATNMLRSARRTSSALQSAFAVSSRRLTSVQQIMAGLEKADDNNRPNWRQCSYTAIRTVSLVVMNASVSVAVCWIAAVCYAQGNFFSGLRPQDQSRATFTISLMLWVHSAFSMCACVARSTALFKAELVSNPGRPAGVLVILRKMITKTCVWFLISAGSLAAIGYGCATLSPAWHMYRLELYASPPWNYSYVPAAEQAARTIFRRDTVQGRERQRLRMLQAPHQRQAKQGTSSRQFLRLLLGNLSLLVALFVPVAYVHVINVVGSMDTLEDVWMLTLVSLVLKLATQELAKFYIIKRKIQSARSMVVLVAIPTVLIDTQVRLHFLRAQSVQATLASTVAMAVMEISARVFKTLLFRYAVYAKRRVIPVVQVVTPTSNDNKPTREAAPVSREAQDFALWRARLYHYHATELMADMYAEYLAIGCSSGIMLILCSHPHFQLGSMLGSSSSSAPGAIYLQLLVQVGVEVVVDCVSCFLEIAAGVNFAFTHRERGYYLIVFITLAICNLNISTLLTLK